MKTKDAVSILHDRYIGDDPKRKASLNKERKKMFCVECGKEIENPTKSSKYCKPKPGKKKSPCAIKAANRAARDKNKGKEKEGCVERKCLKCGDTVYSGDLCDTCKAGNRLIDSSFVY